MKIQCTSDTHGKTWVPNIQESDILLICGDISPVYLPHTFYEQKTWFFDTYLKELESALNMVGDIVFIGGNHDTYLAEMYITNGGDMSNFNEGLPDHIHYLADSEVTIGGIRIYGTPWCNLPAWGRSGPPVWNFAKNDESLNAVYSTIPEGLDILMTHGPSYGFCDQILDESTIERKSEGYGWVPEKLGARSLTNKIESLEKKPKYVFSGHIHSAEHEMQLLKEMDERACNSQFRCVSFLNEQYERGYDPFIFEM